jgi:hypothetical protein
VLRACGSALRLRPAYAKALCLRGRAMMHLARVPAALRAYRAAAAADPAPAGGTAQQLARAELHARLAARPGFVADFARPNVALAGFDSLEQVCLLLLRRAPRGFDLPTRARATGAAHAR